MFITSFGEQNITYKCCSNFLIHLILTSKQKDSERLEILDGLQRLNAITSFLECEFSLNGEFFDLDSITLTKQLKSQGIVKQQTPVLDSDKCSTILNYEIPLSTTISKTNDFIDETFRRILCTRQISQNPYPIRLLPS